MQWLDRRPLPIHYCIGYTDIYARATIHHMLTDIYACAIIHHAQCFRWTDKRTDEREKRQTIAVTLRLRFAARVNKSNICFKIFAVVSNNVMLIPLGLCQ